MNRSAKSHFSKWIPILLIGMMLLSCNFVTNLVSNSSFNQAGSGTPGAAGQPSSGDTEPTGEPDPLDHLLGLRSIIIQLTAQRPDGSNSSTQVEIDSAGNMRVKSSLPAPDTQYLTQGFDTSKLPTSSELFVVDGKAYQPSEVDPAWMSTPMDADYLQTLYDELYGTGWCGRVAGHPAGRQPRLRGTGNGRRF